MADFAAYTPSNLENVMRLNRRELSLLPVAAFVTAQNAYGSEPTQERRFNRPQETVDYRQAPRGKAQCGNCRLFRPSNHGQAQGCLVVASPIVANGSCVLHELVG
jgi:hypothetical protein